MISAPFSVMRMVCSNCAHRPRSLVTTVQLSRHVSQRMPPCGMCLGSQLGDWVRVVYGCRSIWRPALGARGLVPRGVAGAGLGAGVHTPYHGLATRGR